MAVIARKHTSQLDKIKQSVEQSYTYFRPNYERFHQFMRFVYKSTLTEDDIAVLATLGRPQIEFNMMEAYISRLRGEFSRMEPGFVVRAQDGFEDIDPRLLSLLEAHFRAILNDSDNDGFSYDVYTDLLVGGFSVVEVYTDYISAMSMDQKICANRVFDPTLCGFDPLARKSHKGDGGYCFQLFPKEREEVEKEYGSDALKGLKYARAFSGFNWSYRAAKRDIVLMCQYDLKEFKKKRITKLSNGRVVAVDHYEKLLAMWEEAGHIEQAPIPIGKMRDTMLEEITRYTFTGAELIDTPVKTSFSMLPLIFFDGNSAILRDNNDSTAEQMTRPYIYNVRDAQRLKNYAGQSLANELENTVEHKFIASVESIPEDYIDAYIDVQKPGTLLYNQFYEGNPEVSLTPPREVVRTPIPPQISETFQMSDNLIQGILGSYDAALGIQNNELSGVAIMQGAMHSNAAAMPYTVGFMKGWNRVCQQLLDLIPKYYLTPRSIPIVEPDGTRSYQTINKAGSPFMNYDSMSLDVKVEAGVNFAVQKQISLETIIQIMQTSESFANFINTKGLGILLDNIDIRGIEGLRQAAGQYMQEVAQKQAEAEQMAMQQAQQQLDPKQVMAMTAQADMAKVAQKKEAVATQAQVQLTKIATDDAVKNKLADIEMIKVLSDIQGAGVDQALKQEKVDAENARTAVSMAVDVSSHHHDIAHRDREHELSKKAMEKSNDSKD
jgi:DNA-binding TFAR19-related protein (PDSD5 family)